MLQNCLIITFLFLGAFFFSVKSSSAYVQGGPASLKLNPATATATTGQNFSMKVMFTTGGQAISGVAARLSYTVPTSPDLEVVSVTPNASLGWSFPVQSAAISGGKMNIDLMGLTSSPTGYSGSGDIELATITFRAASAFSNKALSFDQSQSQILKKSDASDILGTLGNAVVSASGGSVATITPSPSPTPASNPNSGNDGGSGTTTTTGTTGTGTTGTSGTGTTTSTGTTGTTTSTTTTNVIAESAGVGGGNVVDTPQTQAMPVSGAASATMAVALTGLALVGGALFMRFKQS